MHRHMRPGHLTWTPAPTSLSLCTSEEQEDVFSEVDHSRGGSLEHDLDQIGLWDEAGLGTDCEDAGAVNETEGEAEDLDHGSSLLMVTADQDVSDEEGYEPEEYCHTPIKCLNDDVTPQVPTETPPNLPATPSRAPSLPLLLTPEERASSPGILDEIFPEFFSSQSSSPDTSPNTSPNTSPPPEELNRESHNPKTETRALTEHAAVSKIPRVKRNAAVERRLSTTSLPLNSSCLTKLSPEREGRTRTRQKKAALFSSRIPMVRRPDLSKVEPRVHFPKGGYTPPQSRHRLKSDSASPERPLVYMSPADIVTEVLFSPANGGAQEEEEQTLQALSILPPDFRSKQHAIALVHELQEENSRLKLKCAEAANTIDRLRLEGKVNLYSDPPKPGLPLHSGLRTHASRPLTLHIPCPQRAEVSSSCPSTSTPHTGAQPQLRSPPSSTCSSVGRVSDMFDTLYQQAQGFLQHVEDFEERLQRSKGQTEQQMEVVPELLQKLENMEKGYMSTKKEHKKLQRQGVQTGSFDPQRELENLIFQCGLQMDDVKEQVQQKQSHSPAPPVHQTTPPPPVQTPPIRLHAARDVPLCCSSPSSTEKSSSSVDDTVYQNAKDILLKAYEETLRVGKLQTQHQKKLVQELLQRMNSLERRYQSAEKEHEQRQDTGCFDPHRELYSQIQQIALQVNQLQKNIVQRPSTPTHRPTPTHRTTPTHLATPIRQATPPTLLPTQYFSKSGVEQTQCPSLLGPPSPTVTNSPTPRTADPPTGGHDQADYTQLFQSLRVVPVPLVRDLSRDVGSDTAAEACEREEAWRLSRANTQTPYRNLHREANYNTQPSPPATSKLLQDPPLPSPSTSMPHVGHSSTAEAFEPHTQSHSPSRAGPEVEQMRRTGVSEVGQSPSSSLSSLRETPDRTDHKVPSERTQGSQDGLISPGTDSGFMGSEGSRLTPAAGTSPVHQGEPPGVLGTSLLRPSPGPPVSRQTKEGPVLRAKPSRRSRRASSASSLLSLQPPLRRASSASCSQLPRDAHTQRAASRETRDVHTQRAARRETRDVHTQRAARRESGLSGLCSSHSSSASEEDHSDLSSSSSFSSLSRLGVPIKAPHTGRGARPGAAFHELQPEVVRLRNHVELHDRAEQSAPCSSTPVSRSDGRKAKNRGTTEDNEEEASVKTQTDHTRAVCSKLSQTDSCFPQQVSRLTQTSAQTLHTPYLRLSSERPEEAHRHSRAPVCAGCVWRGRCTGAALKDDASGPSAPCPHSRRSGAAQPGPDGCSPRGPQMVPSSDRGPHVSVCTHPLLLFSPPPAPVLPPAQTSDRPGPRRSREGTWGRRSPTDALCSLDEKLSRALRAARSMKSTSRHMVHTLASGLQYQHRLAHTH